MLNNQLMKIKLAAKPKEDRKFSLPPACLRSDLLLKKQGDIDPLPQPSKITQYLSFLAHSLRTQQALAPVIRLSTLQPISPRQTTKCQTKVDGWRQKLLRRKNNGSYGQIIKGYTAGTQSKKLQPHCPQIKKQKQAEQFVPLGNVQWHRPARFLTERDLPLSKVDKIFISRHKQVEIKIISNRQRILLSPWRT